MKILVSTCLLGVDCCWHGGNNKNEALLSKKDDYTFVPVCPEQLGGLTTPRLPAELGNQLVVTNDGSDVTNAFAKGALETLKLAQLYGCQYAILKANSPSCGCGRIYDGSFTGTLIDGDGITAKRLTENGIKVFTEDTMHLLFELLAL